MKKISVIILALSAFALSCTTPYYPEYHRLVSLGAYTGGDVVIEREAGEFSFPVISNVEYEARIISGETWLSFADADGLSVHKSGNTTLYFKHNKVSEGPRVARVVLSADNRRDTVKIKQKGNYDEFLEMHPNDKANYLTLKDGTRMSIPEEGGEFKIRLEYSCRDTDIKFWVSHPEIVTSCKVENKVFSFIVMPNKANQPNIIDVKLSFINGWDEEVALPFSIRHEWVFKE